MRLVPIGSIKKGTILAKVVYDSHNRILLNQGVELTTSLIERLVSNQVLGVYIHDSYSTEEIRDVISPELRNKAVNEVHTAFKAVQKQMELSIKTLDVDKNMLTKKLHVMSDKKYFETLDGILDDMINEITYNKDAMVGLVDIKNMENFVYQHSIQVCVLSLLIGASLKLNRYQLKDLAIAAMLHDIGHTFIDKSLVVYTPEFTEEQTIAYKSHCKLGHDFIKENTDISAHARMGILQHHEKYNGKGFPLNLHGEHIHLYARIIAIANDYDKMSSGVTGIMVPPNEVIEYIMAGAGDDRSYDLEIAKHFISRIIPFPIGSLVLLSNGKKGVVSGYNVSSPLRPMLKIIDGEQGIFGEEDQLIQYNLLDTDKLNVTIIKTIFDIEEQ